MLEKLIERINKEINERAEIERNIADFVVNLIKENYNVLSEGYKNEIENSFKESLKDLTNKIEEKGYKDIKQEFFENELYSKTRALLDFLEDRLIRPFGVTGYFEEHQTPDIVIGLTKYNYIEDDNGKKLSPCTKVVTEKGKKLINDYLIIQGKMELIIYLEHLLKI